MDSSKATSKHIKQVASDQQATQIHLMRHQCTELPLSKFQRTQKKHYKRRQCTNRQYSHEDNYKQYYKEDKQRRYNSHQAHASQESCKKCGDSKHIEGFGCPVTKYQCKNCHKFGYFSSLCYKKIGYENIAPWSQDHSRQIN